MKRPTICDKVNDYLPPSEYRDHGSRLLRAFVQWLELNDCVTYRDAINLLESSNDNPNIRPLKESA